VEFIPFLVRQHKVIFNLSRQMQQDVALPPGKCIVRPPQMAGDSAVVGFHQYCHTFGAECNFSTETRAAAGRGAHARLNSGASTDRKHPLRPV